MKDMFLAEELGYDPYEPFPADENILTEDDFKVSAMNIKYVISDNYQNAERMFFEKYKDSGFRPKIITRVDQARGIDFTEENTEILDSGFYKKFSSISYENFNKLLSVVERRININKSKQSAR